MRSTLYGKKAGMRMVFIVGCRAQVGISKRKVDVVGTGLLVTSRIPRHGYVGRRGSRDVHQYRRRPTIVNLFVGQTERSSHGVLSESNQPCRDRRPRPRTAVAGKLRTRVSRRSQHGPMPRTLSALSLPPFRLPSSRHLVIPITPTRPLLVVHLLCLQLSSCCPAVVLLLPFTPQGQPETMFHTLLGMHNLP
jgi:hypothetical protein